MDTKEDKSEDTPRPRGWRGGSVVTGGCCKRQGVNKINFWQQKSA